MVVSVSAASEQVLVRAPWVASRTYEDERGSFSALSNAKTHEFMTFENEASVLWSLIDEGTTENDLISKSKALGVSESLNDFIELLKDAELLETELSKSSRMNIKPSQRPGIMKRGASVPQENSSFNEIETAIQDRAIATGALWIFFWEITYRCNEQCVHCFNPGAAHKPGDKSGRKKAAELKRDQIIPLLDDLVKIGVFRLVLSGGEIFVHKDIFFILEEAQKRGFQVHLYTNGLLLTEEKLQRVASFWPDTVSISLYSDDPVKHDAITRVKGSFNKSTKALNLLKEWGIRATVKAPLMNSTAYDWKALDAIAEETGSRIAFDSMISAGNDMNQDPTQLNMDMIQVIELAATPGSPIFVGDKTNNFGKKSKSLKREVCGAGVTLMSMTPEGTVTPCCALPLDVGSVREQSFKEIWESRNSSVQKPIVRPEKLPPEEKVSRTPTTLAEWRSIKLENYEECGTHDRCSWCDKCPGAALNETGNVFSASSVQCKIATGKMEAAKMLERGMTLNEIIREVNLISDSAV